MVRPRFWLLLLAILWTQNPAWTANSEVQTLFEDNCSGCHSIGGGKMEGPDLKDLLKRRQRDWAVHYIHEPDELRKFKDPVALELRKEYPDTEMPNLGMTREQADALVDFIAAGGQAAPPAPKGPVGDAQRGALLFSGRAKFAGGGMACSGCHASKGLGPDLSRTAARLGPAGLANAVKALPYPTMKPVYTGKLLNEQEQADMAAYLSQGAVPAAGNTFLITGICGFVVLLILFGLIWRRS